MIHFTNVTKEFVINKNNRITALKNINLEIQQGEVVVLKGASGSGKSTILSLIVALSKPTTGEVIVNEQRVSKLPDNFASQYRRESVGIIFQKFNLIPNLSVKENILVPLIPKNIQEVQGEERLRAVMEQFKISHKQDVIVKNLSGGEQQRVAIARALVNNPHIIIADEPTANLDKDLSLHFIEEIRDLKKEGKTVVIATHDPLFDDLEFIDTTIHISNGEII